MAIAGGSGSGKTLLATRLARALSPNAIRLSMDDFYLDRSHLPPGRRAKLNFDHPRAIDWPALLRALRSLRRGQTARVPCYDFSKHCRLALPRFCRPKPIILLDGLWPLRRASLRRLCGFRVFLECPSRIRLRRRLARDRATRGRTPASVRTQFWSTVEPMHQRYVEPQARWADVVLKPGWGERELRGLVRQVRQLRAQKHVG